MSGNATEEGLLSQIDNPSHADPTRIVALAGFVAAGLAFVLARWFILDLTVWGGIVIGAGAGILVAAWSANGLRRRRTERQAVAMQLRRALEATETNAGIAAMKRSPNHKGTIA